MAEKKRLAATTERKKMAVDVEPQLRQRLRVFAAQQDVRIKAILGAALDEYLKKRGA